MLIGGVPRIFDSVFSFYIEGVAMFRRYAIVVFALIAIGFTPLNSSAREWTVMVYIAADNNLSTYVNGDVDEMESAGSTGDVAILCQIDGKSSYGGYDDYLGSGWATVRRYEIGSGSSSNGEIDGGFIVDLGELNSEDPDVLRDFANWGIDTYPANRYMLVFWNHGGGWARPAPLGEPFKAIVWDDTDGGGGGIEFSNGEYATMLSEIRNHLGRSINMVCFDACVVGLIETEYETMGYADYLVHSEANIPGDGYDYGFLRSLIADPTMSEEELIGDILNNYASYYSSNITLSGLRLDHDHVDFQIALNDFARQLILAGGQPNSSVSSSITGARDFGSDLVDMIDFAMEVDSRNIGGSGSALDLAAQAFIDSYGYPPMVAGKPLVASVQEGLAGSYGTMAYTPTDSASSSWNGLDIAECSIWKEFINGSTSLPSVKLAYWGNSLGKYIETSGVNDLYITCRNLGSGTASSATATLSSYDSRVTISGGSVSFGSIGGGATAISSTPFSVTVSPLVSDSSFIPFEITFDTGNKQKFVLTALGEVNFVPNRTDLIAPFDNARLTDGGVLLSWAVPLDSDGDPLHFDVQWDTEKDFSSPVTISSDASGVGFGPSVPRTTGDCNYLVGSQGEGEFVDGVTYWWRVRARDGFNDGAWSSARSLTIDESLAEFDWHQTTRAQFLADDIVGASVPGDYVTVEENSVAIFDDMEYASEAAAWAVWDIHTASSVEITLEDRRQVSGMNSLRMFDNSSYSYGGAWRSFDPITIGVARVWAKVYSSTSGYKAEFLGLHDGTDYTSTFTTGLLVYCKAETLKYWDGSGNNIHTSLDSLWHYYEIEFDLIAGVSDLYIDGIHSGSFGSGSLSEIGMLAVGSKLLGNAARSAAYWDDFEVSSLGGADSGVVVGTAVAYDLKPSGTDSWGWASWNQNAGDSILVTAQYFEGGSWIDFASAIATGVLGEIDLHSLGSADSVRLRAVLFFREGFSEPILYDWTVDWNDLLVDMDDEVAKPYAIELYPNCPNPFNAVTTFCYEIPEESPVQIAIYNIAGERVFEDEGFKHAGTHMFRFDAGDLPSGAYFCRLSAAGQTVERRVVLIK